MAIGKAQGIPELIPNYVGQGVVRSARQKRTLIQWSTLALSGLAAYHQKIFDIPQSTRAAALGLVFPGAGFIACANITGTLALIATMALLPVTLFAWFGAGGVLFPVLLWMLAIIGAYFAAGDSLFEHAGIMAAILLGSFMLYFNRFSAKARALGDSTRQSRNEFLPGVLAKIDDQKSLPPPPGDREIDLETARAVQYLIDQGLRDLNDFTDFTTVDQFQTSALRYQLYENMYVLGAYQGIYTPNFHGYLSQSIRTYIEKSLLKKVLGFWKWETLWGKFSTNYDPVKEDNIMVTGFLLQGMMIYMANTGDMRYTEPGSMKFEVDDDHIYPNNIHSMDASLVKQWTKNDYCFFPCEPNWIYTPCNFQGMTGQIVYDRVFGVNHASVLMPRFEESLNRNFTETSGSILPIRSELTGFTIPGLCGALADLANAGMTRGYLDHISRRMYATFKHETIHYDPMTKELNLIGLVGADKIDPGTYKANQYTIYSMLSYVAGEFGDEAIRIAALSKVVDNIGLETTPTGAKRLPLSQASPSFNSMLVRGRLLRYGDWKNLIGKGPLPTTLAGPILESVPYPGVLVAKAYSHTSKDLDLVLYPSAQTGTFTLGVEKLVAGASYSIGGGKPALVADARGKLSFDVHVDGRTQVKIVPVGA